jgi:hypothetical protein
MAVTAARIQALVELELTGLRDDLQASRVRSLLVPPQIKMLEWDYGEPEQTYPCWSVLNHTELNVGIVYSEFGFGPERPWGLVWLSGAHTGIGMDSGWFDTFMDAFTDLGA